MKTLIKPKTKKVAAKKKAATKKKKVSSGNKKLDLGIQALLKPKKD